LNEPVSTEDQLFREEWFNSYMQMDLKTRYLNKFLCVDPAISMEDGRDYTVFVIVGVDENNNLFILLIDRGKYTPAQIVEKFIDYATRYETLDNGLETVAYQKSLRYYINDKMRDSGTFIKITELKSHTHQSKEVRIRGLQPRYEMGTIYHKAGDPTTNELEYELLHFPKGKHDDIIDTLASTLEILYAPVKGKTQHKKKKHKSAKKYQSNAMKW
jgi:predicted phage terminase large subunit-like protein